MSCHLMSLSCLAAPASVSSQTSGRLHLDPKVYTNLATFAGMQYRHDMACSTGMTRHGMTRHGMAWHGVWHATAPKRHCCLDLRRLTDFGLARMLDLDKSHVSTKSFGCVARHLEFDVFF